MKKIFLAFALLTIFLAVPVFAAPYYNAASVLVLDLETGEVLYETDGFSRRYPASITKVMTALIVLEEVENLHERVTFSQNAVTLPSYAGRMEIEAGEQMTVLQALYGIMLPSANDIARALAEHVSGNIPDFVAHMNRRAEEIGAYDTRFVNPCGLPGSGQHVTAYDVALIMKAAISHPLFVEIISTPYFTLPPTNLYEEPRQMRNSNQLIRPGHENFDPRIIGSKTGFTNAAQHTLVSYAAYDGFEIIVTVLYSSPAGATFTDTASILDYIFENFPKEEIPDEPEEPEAAPVFVYKLETYDHPPPRREEPPPPPEIAPEEATISAAESIIIAGIALLALWLMAEFFKRMER